MHPTTFSICARTEAKMEARFAQAHVLKKIIDSLKDLVECANLECSPTGISLQSLDSSHVAMVSLTLYNRGFQHFNCPRSICLGIPIETLGKGLQLASANDEITMRAKDSAESVCFLIENPSASRVSDFSVKLMDIDAEAMTIPDMNYICNIQMCAKELQRICKEIAAFGDTVTISASKNGVKFTASGDSSSGGVYCLARSQPFRRVTRTGSTGSSRAASSAAGETSQPSPSRRPRVKPRIEEEDPLDDRKHVASKPSSSSGRLGPLAGGKRRRVDSQEDESDDTGAYIVTKKNAQFSFALKYLALFTRAAPLAKYVILKMDDDKPMLVQYLIESGHENKPPLGVLDFFLAPKIDDESENRADADNQAGAPADETVLNPPEEISSET